MLLGIHDVIHMALNKIDPHNSKSLHVSFDIDVLDPLEAPSTGTPGLRLIISVYIYIILIINPYICIFV